MGGSAAAATLCARAAAGRSSRNATAPEESDERCYIASETKTQHTYYDIPKRSWHVT